MAKVRMADIAEKIGVSVVTVSKALSGKTGVSDEMREKIKAIAADMRYEIPTQKPKNRKGVTGNVGVIIPSRFLNKTNSFYWEMYEKVVSCLMSDGYYGILEILKEDDEKMLNTPRILQDAKADGIIMIGHISGKYHDFLCSMERIPVMFLDSYDARSGDDSVISDGYYGMFALTDYLIRMGHSDIHFVGTVNATSSISDRYFGFCRAMSEHGLTVTPEMVIPDRVPGGSIDIELPEKLPTAYVCNCDLTAYEVISHLKARKINVPEHISIVGFDDYVLSEPAITTYAVDIPGMAKACVESLLKKMRNANYKPNLKIVSGRIKIKDSVRRLD